MLANGCIVSYLVECLQGYYIVYKRQKRASYKEPTGRLKSGASGWGNFGCISLQTVALFDCWSIGKTCNTLITKKLMELQVHAPHETTPTFTEK